MSEQSIQLFWAAPEGVSTYAVYRLLRDDSIDPGTVELTDDHLLYRGPEVGYTDETVVAGEQYWYVMVVELPDRSIQQRWTVADAVTDTEPPARVAGLQATRVADTIELKWDQSSDNYQFARYAIRRSIDGGDSIYYGTGFSVEQTGFIDDQLPERGTVTYELISTDFHDNRAEPSTVTVALD